MFVAAILNLFLAACVQSHCIRIGLSSRVAHVQSWHPFEVLYHCLQRNSQKVPVIPDWLCHWLSGMLWLVQLCSYPNDFCLVGGRCSLYVLVRFLYFEELWCTRPVQTAYFTSLFWSSSQVCFKFHPNLCRFMKFSVHNGFRLVCPAFRSGPFPDDFSLCQLFQATLAADIQPCPSTCPCFSDSEKYDIRASQRYLSNSCTTSPSKVCHLRESDMSRKWNLGTCKKKYH